MTVDQVFHQANPNPLDIIYTFPLPDGAAVYRCELVANDRVIRAKVMSESETRKAANEAKAAGRRAALVESIRPNLFELQLADAQPDDPLIVKLSWFQLLDTQQNRERLRIPFCPGIRYIPGRPLLRDNQGRGTIDDTDQVPDASHLSPPRITELHPEATLVSVEGTIDTTGIDFESLSSPTHQIILRLPTQEGDPCTLRLSDSHQVADRDFVIEMQDAKAQTPITKAWITEDESGAYAYLCLRAPEMKLTIDHAGVHGAEPERPPEPLVLWILLDRSGSMQGSKWTQSRKALHKIVAELRDDDLVWLTFFDSSYHDFAERPLPVSTLRADRNFHKIECLGTGGGTSFGSDHDGSVAK